jgi:hypothetical protein
MRARTIPLLSACAAGLIACAGRGPAPASPSGTPARRLAQIYFWRARPGKLEEYNRYIRVVAEPIDRAAQRHNAFLSVTTYLSRDTGTAWTHMRVFILRDSAQLAALPEALERAGIQLEPDSASRRVRGEYAATIRERVGAVTVEVLP